MAPGGSRPQAGGGILRASRSVPRRFGLPRTIVASQSCSLHPLLFEATWWRERLRAMDRVPRHLLVFPRAELSIPGGEALELWLRAHDGIRLRGILGRSLLALPEPELRLELLAPGESAELEWDEISRGRADLLFEPPPSRRLEDRVLDAVRICQASRAVTGVPSGPLRLVMQGPRAADELQIADRLLSQGWI